MNFGSFECVCIKICIIIFVVILFVCLLLFVCCYCCCYYCGVFFGVHCCRCFFFVFFNNDSKFNNSRVEIRNKSSLMRSLLTRCSSAIKGQTKNSVQSTFLGNSRPFRRRRQFHSHLFTATWAGGKRTTRGSNIF